MKLLVLCLAAFALVASMTSLGIELILPRLQDLAARLAPRPRVRLWIGVILLPLTVGLLSVVVSFLPLLGVGTDHCLAHGPHHPHLCYRHMTGTPGVLLHLVAVVCLVRLAHATYVTVSTLYLGASTADAMRQASERAADIHVFPSAERRAFVAGHFRPRIYVSRGLFSLGSEFVEPVVAHERAHALGLDVLWRALCPLIGCGHLPWLMAHLRHQLAAAQELAADAEAAAGLEDGHLRVARALLLLSRERLHQRVDRAIAPAAEIGFAEGDLKARVRALLERDRAPSVWAARGLWFGVLILPAALLGFHGAVHHALETILGTLS